MTSLLSLNYDVLSLVLAFLSPHNAAQLALTSHQAHALAMPRVLAHVSLGGVFHKPAGTAAHQLTSFCRYMLADVSTRLSCLRSLTIMRDAVRKRVCGVWAVDVECARVLAEMLARAKNLQKVTIWGMDALVQAHPPIVDALASCEFLHTVCLGGEIPELSVLTRAFPHVRLLQFVDGGGSFGADWDVEDIELPQDGWPCLDRVDSGHPILPLARPVRRVDLRNALPADELAINNALRFIKRTQPVVLSCSVDVSVPDAAFVARMPEVAENLKFLELILHGCESLAGVTSWMVRVAQTLSTLPLAGLVLYSDTPASFPTPRPSPAQSPLSSPTLSHATLPGHEAVPVPTLPPTVQRAFPPDMITVARSIALAVPSVRYVALQPSAPQVRNAYEPDWFAVEDGVEGRKVRAMAEMEGAATARMLRGLDKYD